MKTKAVVMVEQLNYFNVTAKNRPYKTHNRNKITSNHKNALKRMHQCRVNVTAPSLKL